MSFMQPEITNKSRHWAVECCHGETHYVPCDVVTVPDQFKDGARFEPIGECGGAIWNALVSWLKDYAPDEPEAIEVTAPGYLGRYSAPGYMDCTDWTFSTNLRVLQSELRDMYGED